MAEECIRAYLYYHNTPFFVGFYRLTVILRKSRMKKLGTDKDLIGTMSALTSVTKACFDMYIKFSMIKNNTGQDPYNFQKAR